MDQEILVEVMDVTKSYNRGVRALEHINLSIARGEWVSFMGPSGSGKTTLLNIIGCLDKPTSGLVKVDGTEIGKLSGRELTRFRREKVGLIFQQFHLVPYLNVLENVMLAQYFHSMADETSAREAVERVGMGGRLHHLPSQLSGGEQQRVCIARALINEPMIVLADEPTGNLDKENEDLVMELFRSLHREGHTLVVVTHDDEIARMGQRIVRLSHGRMVTQEDLVCAPRS
ncbi:MAG: ABC transporter ATP-binding protein [Dehalococcoidia bacterium]|nr:ABC transporter ATP-binding protein [Dehalococcoidia bacterium]